MKEVELGQSIRPISGNQIEEWYKQHRYRCEECRKHPDSNYPYVHFLYERYPYLFPKGSLDNLLVAPVPWTTFRRRVQYARSGGRE